MDTIKNKTNRPNKPRKSGISHILEKGMGVRAVADMVETSGEYIDIVKLGWGTSLMYPEKILKEKIRLMREGNIHVSVGGTLVEAAIINNRFDQLLLWMEEMGFDVIEISDGTIDIKLDEKVNYILRAQEAGFKTLAEIGKKDASVPTIAEEWLDELKVLLDIPYCKIVMEARESGTVGIYLKSGDPKTGILGEILPHIKKDLDRIIWEAPLKSQQTWFIKHLGSRVNLGNIPPEDAIPLETLRRGLRGDTLLTFHKP